jgi:Macrocin-O-methyltransferase (TylF)
MNCEEVREAYLELIKRALMDAFHDRANLTPIKYLVSNSWKMRALKFFDSIIRNKNYFVVFNAPSDMEERMQGKGTWPQFAQTMVGINRLNNIQYCIEQVIKNNIAGDLIETGVWRGGSTILMRAILKSYAVTDRFVWVADSFEGLPKPDVSKYPADKGDTYHTYSELKVSVEDVKNNFIKFGLLDDKVRFLKGWFKDTLPTAPIEKLSVLRLDGDMYESTMDALLNLYPKLSVGGYIIIDDYLWIPACRQAVSDYRRKHEIEDEIIEIDWTAVYWQKSK